MTSHPEMVADFTPDDLAAAARAIRRGAPIGDMSPCSCFRVPPRKRDCFGICLDSAESVARAIAAARREGDATKGRPMSSIAWMGATALVSSAEKVLAKGLAEASPNELREILRGLVVALDRNRRWIADLQSGLYVNCVYCGHRYGPDGTTPVTMADALKAHVAQCAEHPMAALADAGVAAYHALKSYQFGNAAQDLAEGVAGKMAETLERAGRPI